MPSVFEFIMSRRRAGDGRRGAIVLVAALAVFLTALMFSSSSAYGAPEAKPPPAKAAKTKPTKKKPKVKAGIRRGQLDVLGTAKNDRITLRLKPRNKSRLQVDVGSNGSAEFTFKRSAFNRVVVHGGSGADALSINERNGVFTGSEATSLFGDAGNDLLRSGSAAERLFGGIGNDTIDGKRGNDLIEGGAGSDLVVFNGSNAAERFAFSASRNRLRFVAASTMNIAGVERFDLRASGGVDNVVVNDLAGARLGQLNADLGQGGAADVVDIKGSSAANELRVGGGISIGGIGAAVNVLRAQAANDKLNIDPGAGSDRVVVEGTAGNDTIGVAASAVAPHIAVSGGPGGLPIDVVNSEALAVESLASNDTLNAGLGLAALTQLTLDGGAGNDAINGGDGAEVLAGRDGDDAIDGNRGDDTGLLGAGDDTFTWDPGDGSDKVEGEAGTDTLVFNGAGVAEDFDFSANGNRLRFFRNVANITMDVDDTERVDLRALGGIDNAVVNDLSATDVKNIVLDLASDGAVDTATINGTAGNDTITIAPNAGAVDVTGLAAAVKIAGSEAANDLLNVNGLGGNDTISGAIGLAALIKLGIDGGAGDDTINGGDGAEVLAGGDGIDAIDGNRGDDTGLLGAGDDSFTWDPGDGSDKVEGEAGTDTLVFNGAGVAEDFDFSANGNRLRFFRNVANITMDVDGTERVDLRALGGIDTTVVNDLSATDVKNVELDLETAIGGGAGDGAVDTATINGSVGNDTIAIAPNAGAVDVTGLAAAVKIEHSEAANDVLNVNGLDGNDTISAAVGLAALIKVGIDGGAGNDTINGGDGAEVLVGSDGNDAIDGNRGDDTGLLGAGDDSFRWDPGDGSDVVEGQDGADDGADTLLFIGAGVGENFDVSANGERVKFFRDVANITMDLNDTEFIDVQALGGNDNAVLNDTTGTDLKSVALDLEAAIGGGRGDGAADSVTVNGTNNPDDIQITATGSAVDVNGVPPTVQIDHPEAANDKLTVNGLGGADTITGGPDLAALIQLVINGGTEVDVLTGGDGNDRIVGQQQNDSMFGGDGNDTLVWNPGDANDLVEGQAGNDTMEFNGTAVSEGFEASAVAGRLRFTRNIGNIVMDVDGTERVDLRALGGQDATVVNDLSGTDVTKADIDLSAAIGGGAGDGVADAITVNGTDGPDNVAVAANGGVVDLTGLFTAVSISHSEVANDSLAINTLGGNDDVDIGGGVAGLIQTHVDLGGDE
jgi:Ca2+-binding RTX toxin-like protein